MIFDSINLNDWTNGQPETLKSFCIQDLKSLNLNYLAWFNQLKSYHSFENYIFVHAGLNFNLDNPLDDTKSMAWITDWYNSIDKKWLKNRKVIHGHVPISTQEIKLRIQQFDDAKYLNIDNGCYLKDQPDYGNLCCVELTKREVIFQQNID